MSVSSPDPIFWISDYSKVFRRPPRPSLCLDEGSSLFFLALAASCTVITFNLSYICLRKKRPMMFLSAGVGIATTMLVLWTPLPAFAADTTVDPNLVARLKTAATAYDRLNMLSDQQLVYNFSTNPNYSWQPGSVCNANAATWPVLSAVSGPGSTVSQLNLGPCAMLAPHIHRANNLVVAVTGTTHTFMVQENGARLVQQVLEPGLMTIFPPASLHSMYNMGCGYNLLYSFLDSADPGTLNMAQAFFMMGQDIGMQVMPFINLSGGNWTETAKWIPDYGTGSQAGFEACRVRCGLDDTAAGGGRIVV